MSSRRPKVLIVDDEANLVLALFRVLYQDNHRYDVLLASTAEIAQQILVELTIDVLVTDVKLPERSGMDLLTWVVAQSPSTRVFVMSAFDMSGIKDMARALGCLQLIHKPFDVREMRATILSALDRRDTFAGSLADLPVPDVIQMLCLSRRTTALRLSAGDSSGVILIENGDLVHAIWDNLVGESALFKMLSVKNGRFYTSPLRPDVQRTLRGDWQALLAKGLSKQGEATAQSDQPRSAQFVTTSAESGDKSLAAASTAMESVSVGVSTAIAARNIQAQVSQLIDEGFTALRSGNKDEARRLWQEALQLDPSNRMLQLNLRKLDAKNARS